RRDDGRDYALDSDHQGGLSAARARAGGGRSDVRRELVRGLLPNHAAVAGADPMSDRYVDLPVRLARGFEHHHAGELEDPDAVTADARLRLAGAEGVGHRHRRSHHGNDHGTRAGGADARNEPRGAPLIATGGNESGSGLATSALEHSERSHA